MKKFRILKVPKILIFALFVTSLLACQTFNQSKDSNEGNIELIKNIEYSPNGKYEKGNISNGIYKNSYFGFQFQVPKDLIVLNSFEFEEMLDINRSILYDKDNDLGDKFDNSRSNWNELITLENIDSAQSMSIFREKLESKFADNKEYLEYSKWFMTEKHSDGDPKYFGGEIEYGKICSRTFLVQTFTCRYSDGYKYYIKSYSAQFDNDLLYFTMNYETESGLKRLEDIIESIQWINK